MAEEFKGNTYTEINDGDGLGVTGGGGDYPEYKMLEADEAIKAFVQDIKTGQKPKYQGAPGEVEDRIYFWFELSEGEGKGQRYRYDCKPTLTQGKGKKASNFDELMMKLVGKYPAAGEFKNSDIIGLPIRVELTEPKEYSGREMQFVGAFKKPTADQKRVAPEAKDVVLENIPDGEIDMSELDKVYGGE